MIKSICAAVIVIDTGGAMKWSIITCEASEVELPDKDAATQYISVFAVTMPYYLSLYS